MTYFVFPALMVRPDRVLNSWKIWKRHFNCCSILLSERKILRSSAYPSRICFLPLRDFHGDRFLSVAILSISTFKVVKKDVYPSYNFRGKVVKF